MPNCEGVENLTANVPAPLAKKITQLAAESGLSRSKYMRALLEEAAVKRRVFRLRFQEFVEEVPVSKAKAK